MTLPIILALWWGMALRACFAATTAITGVSR